MKPVSIGSATTVYDTASKCEITRHWVDHPELADTSRLLRSLIQSLDSEVEQEFWQQVIGPMRRLTFALCSTPLPFHIAAVATRVDFGNLRRQVRRCQQIYPDSHAQLANLLQKLECLIGETVSPFTAPLESLHAETSNLSVVLCNSRMNEAVTAYFRSSSHLRNSKVVSARQLRESHLRDSLAVIGPCGWFPDYVFSAPRSEQIHVLSYRWIRDNWSPGPVFLTAEGAAGDKSSRHFVGLLPKMKFQAVAPSQALPYIEPLDLLPPLATFKKVESAISKWKSSAGDETSPARLCYLSGGRAVFAAADEGATSLIIDSGETGDSLVRRVPADELEPDLYLLLRTSGGGDFIGPLADRILGDLAAERRAQQAEWKDRLISAAEEQFGRLRPRELASGILSNLRALNLSEARPANVH